MYAQLYYSNTWFFTVPPLGCTIFKILDNSLAVTGLLDLSLIWCLLACTWLV